MGHPSERQAAAVTGHEAPALPICAATMSPGAPLFGGGVLNDREGEALPSTLPPVVDAHVHLFPDPMFEAIWRWFDRHGWPVRWASWTCRPVPTAAVCWSWPAGSGPGLWAGRRRR